MKNNNKDQLNSSKSENQINRTLHKILDFIRLSLPFILLISGSIMWKFLSPEYSNSIENYIAGLSNNFLAFPIVLVVYCILSLLVFPISILLYGTILTFDFFPGILYAVSGTMAAAVLNYYQGKIFSQKYLHQFLENRKLNDLKVALQTPGLATIIVIRLTPLAPFTIENYLAGAVGVNFRNYALGTFLGLFPSILSIGFITTALKPYIQNPVFYIPIYFAMSSVLLLLVFSVRKAIEGIARYFEQKKIGSTVYTKLDQIDNIQSFFSHKNWLASYLNNLNYGKEGKNYFVKVQSGSNYEVLMLFQLVSIAALDLLKFASSGNVVVRRVIHPLSRFLLKNRKINILINGCPMLTGDLRILGSTGDFNETDITISALKKLKRIVKYDAVIIKDISKPFEKKLPEYKEFQVEPNMVIEIVWKDMKSYIESLRTKYRQRYHSTQKKSSKIEQKKMSFLEIVEHNAEINNLFASVLKSDKFNLENVDQDYFQRASLTPGFTFYGYFIGWQMVAFRTSIVADNEIIAHYVGYDVEINEENRVYLRMLYDYLEEAVQNNYRTLHLGRTALEIKSSIGAVRQEFTLLYNSRNWLFAALGKYFIGKIPATSFIPRSPFK
ncbi:MAG: VTT domain-containing protein [Leptospiraceae bacterium]|nr:VTT domain-containing protein [Leptospiraceae bacterium]